MFKNILRSIKKNRTNENEKQRSEAKTPKCKKQAISDLSCSTPKTTRHDEGNGGASGRRTPLLKWSASLDSLLRMTGQERSGNTLSYQSQEDSINSQSTRDETGNGSNNLLDITNLPDEYKVVLGLDTPQFCSTEKSNRSRNVKTYSLQVQDTSGSALRVSHIEVLDHHTGNPSTPHTKHGQHTPLQRTPSSLYKDDVLSDIQQMMSSRHPVSSHNTHKESFVPNSEFGLRHHHETDTSKRHAQRTTTHSFPDNITKPQEKMNLFEMFQPIDGQHWSIVPLSFYHFHEDELFTLACDTYNQPFISRLGTNRFLRKQDRFLEINGNLVLNMTANEIIKIFESFPFGETMKVVVLRKTSNSHGSGSELPSSSRKSEDQASSWE